MSISQRNKGTLSLLLVIFCLPCFSQTRQPPDDQQVRKVHRELLRDPLPTREKISEELYQEEDDVEIRRISKIWDWFNKLSLPLIVVIIFIFIMLIYLLFRNTTIFTSAKITESSERMSQGKKTFAESKTASPSELWNKVIVLEKAGQLSEALLVLYAASIAVLEKNKIIQRAENSTNSEILKTLGAYPKYLSSFALLARAAEKITFGHQTIGSQEYGSIKGEFIRAFRL